MLANMKQWQNPQIHLDAGAVSFWSQVLLSSITTCVFFLRSMLTFYACFTITQVNLGYPHFLNAISGWRNIRQKEFIWLYYFVDRYFSAVKTLRLYFFSIPASPYILCSINCNSLEIIPYLKFIIHSMFKGVNFLMVEWESEYFLWHMTIILDLQLQLLFDNRYI